MMAVGVAADKMFDEKVGAVKMTAVDVTASKVAAIDWCFSFFFGCDVNDLIKKSFIFDETVYRRKKRLKKIPDIQNNTDLEI